MTPFVGLWLDDGMSEGQVIQIEVSTENEWIYVTVSDDADCIDETIWATLIERYRGAGWDVDVIPQKTSTPSESGNGAMQHDSDQGP